MTTQQQIDPSSVNASGIAALKAGDYARAAELFSLAASVDTNASALWRNLAHARRELGDNEGERVALESALAADRTDFSAWVRMAQLHERLGEERQAMVAWSGVLQMAAAIDPKPDSLRDLLKHGENYCDTTRTRLQTKIGEALEDSIAALPPMEQRRTRAFVDHAIGGRPIYQNECAGLYYPFLPADEYFDDAHFAWFDELAASTDAIRAELLALIADPGDAIQPYVQQDKGTPTNKWSPLDHRLDWGACFLWKYGEPNTPVLDRCPATAAALARVPAAHIPARAPSAFFSILQPHTRIPPHTGVTNTRAIIHLPLIVPENCAFRVGGETRIWQEGVPFAFDDSIDHEARNDSDRFRAVLIFDVWNPHLTEGEQQMIAAYYAAADANID